METAWASQMAKIFVVGWGKYHKSIASISKKSNIFGIKKD